MQLLLHFRFNDGYLEVAGLYSALHIAKLQMNLAEPVKLGRAKQVKVSNVMNVCLISTEARKNCIGVLLPLKLFLKDRAHHQLYDLIKLTCLVKHLYINQQFQRK